MSREDFTGSFSVQAAQSSLFMSFCLFPVHHYWLPPWQHPMSSCTYISALSVCAPLCVPSHTQCYHKASECHTGPVSWFYVPGNRLFLPYPQDSTNSNCPKNCTYWVVYLHLMHINLLWLWFHGYKLLLYLNIEIIGYITTERPKLLKYQLSIW